MAFATCEDQGWKRVLLCGVSELAEIATLRAGDHGVELVGNYDPDCQDEWFLRIPVFHKVSQALVYDACLLTALEETSVRHMESQEALDQGRLIVPSLLKAALL